MSQKKYILLIYIIKKFFQESNSKIPQKYTNISDFGSFYYFDKISLQKNTDMIVAHAGIVKILKNDLFLFYNLDLISRLTALRRVSMPSVDTG